MDFYINLAKIFMYFLYKYIYLEVINEVLKVPCTNGCLISSTRAVGSIAELDLSSKNSTSLDF